MHDTSSPSADAPVLLEAHGISKAFPGVQALHDVRLTVRRGRLNAVLGENGAGKSTLMNILSGVFPPDGGSITLAGEAVHFRNPREAQEAGVSIVHQELNLIPHLSIAENIFLGREPVNRLGLVDYTRMHRDARALVAQLELDVDPRTSVARLPIGAQQVVEIAKALSFRSQIIIMDEPTSAITEQEVDSLFRLIRQLKERGIGIIYITHKLDELKRLADDVMVLRDGRFVAEAPFKSLTREQIIGLMVGRELLDHSPKTKGVIGDEALRVDQMSLRHPVRSNQWLLESVSFAVRQGEVVGIFGLMGAGRTELLESIFGMHSRATTGTVFMNGQRMAIRSPRHAIAAGLALAPEDRKSDGLVLPMNVTENVSLASLKTLSRFGFVQRARESELVERHLRRLGAKTPTLRQPARNLSGGNQQKVVFSKWLATNPQVLLLDEPTRGIDIRAKQEIYAIIDELARRGLAVVMVSSELPEILAVADRILVMAEGRIAGEFKRGAATEENVLKAALPTGKPEASLSA